MEKNVPKSVWHMQDCCFAYLTSYFFHALMVVALVIAKAPTLLAVKKTVIIT